MTSGIKAQLEILGLQWTITVIKSNTIIFFSKTICFYKIRVVDCTIFFKVHK